MENIYRKMEDSEFISYIDKLSNNLNYYLKNNNIKIDYVCPILRGGSIPAVYIANRLNIIKFFPIQVKHVKYKSGEEKIEMLLNSCDLDIVKNKKPVFLLVDEKHYSGTSAKLCIDAIKEKYKDAIILYICVARKYGSLSFGTSVVYEDCGCYFKDSNDFNEDVKDLDIEPVFPWEILEQEISHPDDLEENIFF